VTIPAARTGNDAGARLAAPRARTVIASMG
jgi:hypothetical protein